MKTVLRCILAGLCVISMPSLAQEEFTIIGKVGELTDGTKVRLMYGGVRPTEEAVVSNGTFEFSGVVPEPIYVTVSTRPGWRMVDGALERSYQGFFLEGGETTVTGPTIEGSEILGGPTQKEFSERGVGIISEWLYEVALPRMWGWYNDKALFYRLSPAFEARLKQRDVFREAYIRAHPDSYVSLYLLRQVAGKSGIDPSDPLFNVLSERMRATRGGKELAMKLNALKWVGIGKIAPEFAQTDMTGNEVRLSDLRGKYVLVEFWASWCRPCREENPNLVKAYEKFRHRNFEIIGVSLDDKKGLWLRAIQKDMLPWVNVSDLRGRENAIAKAWGVGAVPNNFLLDPHGIVIAQNLRGGALHTKLEEIFKD